MEKIINLLSQRINYMNLLISIFLLLASIFNNANAELRGKGRDDFVQNFKESCIDSMKNESSGKGMNPDLMKKMCGCMATYYADNSDINQIIIETSAQANGKNSEWWEKMKKNSGAYCIKNLAKY